MEKRLRIAVTLLAILFVILTITCANLLMWSHEYRGQINERFQENFNELCSGTGFPGKTATRSLPC